MPGTGVGTGVEIGVLNFEFLMTATHPVREGEGGNSKLRIQNSDFFSWRDACASMTTAVSSGFLVLVLMRSLES